MSAIESSLSVADAAVHPAPRTIFVAAVLCLLSFLLSGCGAQSSAPRSDEVDAPQAESIGGSEHSADQRSISVQIVSPPKSSEASAPSETSGSSETALAYEESFEVADGTTLEEVMRKIQSPSIEISGSGVTAFVQSIDGVANQASRGWTYTIDGDFATKGIGSTELTPGQTVRWQFTTAKEAMEQN